MNSKERHELRYQRRKQKREEQRMKIAIEADDYGKVFTYDHLFQAYLKCRKNVRWKPSVQKFIMNAALNVYNIYIDMKEGTFKSDGFHEFDIFERGKKRHIRSVTIRERVVQRCFCDYSLVPMIRRFLIYDNGASISGKGYSFAIKRFERHLMWHYRKYGKKGFILQYDFKSYFDNIPHWLLARILRKVYRDDRLYQLAMYLIEMFGVKGLGLGSQVSQILSLAAANELDHYIKEELGIHCYGRFADDGYITHLDKDSLKECWSLIKVKCGELGLMLHDRKTKISPLRAKIRWLKVLYTMNESGGVVRRVWHNSVVRMRQKLKKFRRMVDRGIMSIKDVQASVASWFGYIKRFNIHRTAEKIKELIHMLFGEEISYGVL